MPEIAVSYTHKRTPRTQFPDGATTTHASRWVPRRGGEGRQAGNQPLESEAAL